MSREQFYYRLLFLTLRSCYPTTAKYSVPTVKLLRIVGIQTYWNHRVSGRRVFVKFEFWRLVRCAPHGKVWQKTNRPRRQKHPLNGGFRLFLNTFCVASQTTPLIVVFVTVSNKILFAKIKKKNIKNRLSQILTIGFHVYSSIVCILNFIFTSTLCSPQS